MTLSFDTVEALEPRTFLAAVRVMPLGDSITEAFAPNESYRYWLWHELRDAGFKNVNFVGSRRGVMNGSPALGNFDQDHEGHVGWTADQILSEIPTWAHTYRPDVVLMHLGTNDVRYDHPNASTIDELGSVIDAIRAANPNVTVLLSKLIPNAERTVQTRRLNNLIPKLAKVKNTHDSRVILVDPTRGFRLWDDTGEGLHPNESGENKLAAAFADPLKSVLRNMPARGAAPLAEGETSLSDLDWRSATNAIGPVERDFSNGENFAEDGRPISILGHEYDRGLGVHAGSRIEYVLDGQRRTFAADVGIDDEANGQGSAVFKIYGDGKLLFSSRKLTGADAAQSIQVDIGGVRRLVLIVSDAGDGNHWDHADWANARLIS
jgi:acyl-CoA thioesterase I